MKVEIQTYRFCNDYGWSWKTPKAFGNQCPKWTRPIAKFLHTLKGKSFILISINSKR